MQSVVHRWASATVVLLLLTARSGWTGGQRAAEEAHYPASVEIPLLTVPPGSFTIDGELSEWADIPRTYISARWNQVPGTSGTANNPDRAVFQLARDDSTLYVAVRVVDGDIANPFEAGDLWQGDCVELFLDVRPPGRLGPDAVLGSRYYTPGCYHLLVAPVSATGEATARWSCPQSYPGVPRNLRVASKLLSDGYELEVGIMFAELDGATAARFGEPIGFDLAVDDVDKALSGGLSARVQYSWQVNSDADSMATDFGRLVPSRPGARRAGIVGFLPAAFQVRGSQRSLVAGVAVPSERPADPSDMAFSFTFAGSRADRPERVEDWEVASEEAKPEASLTSDVWEDPILGLQLLEKRLVFSQLVGGRYTATCTFTGAGESVSETTRHYCRELQQRGRMRPVSKYFTDDDAAKLLTSEVLLRTDQHHLFDAAEASLEVLPFFISAGFWWVVSEGAEHADRALSVRLSLERLPGNTPVWTGSKVLGFRTTVFTVPVKDLPEGAYTVRATIVDPHGREYPAWQPADLLIPGWPPAVVLAIHRGREYTLASSIKEALTMLTRAVVVGDPYRERYPNDDRLHCYARSIWDLQTYRGRVYTCCGDYNENQGPVEVCSFAPDPAADHGVRFVNEFTCDDEAVHVLRELAGRLVAPGADARESWELGNIYIKEEGAWRKLRTVPNGIHVEDVAWFDGKLYVTAVTEAGPALYESLDWGHTWVRCSTEDQAGLGFVVYGELAPIGGSFW